MFENLAGGIRNGLGALRIHIQISNHLAIARKIENFQMESVGHYYHHQKPFFLWELTIVPMVDQILKFSFNQFQVFFFSLLPEFYRSIGKIVM